jgi:hypothetical protein
MVTLESYEAPSNLASSGDGMLASGSGLTCHVIP